MNLFKSEEEKVQDKNSQMLEKLKEDFDVDIDVLTNLFDVYNNDGDLLRRVLEEFANTKRIAVTAYLSNIIEVYKTLGNKDLYLKYIHSFVKMPSFISRNINRVMTCFSDKEVAIDIICYITNNNDLLEYTSPTALEALLDYVVEARVYYVDERALNSSFISLVKNTDPTLLKYGDNKKVRREINKKLAEDKKLCGIYSIDQFTLKEVDRKLDEIGVISEKLSTLVDSADDQIKILRDSLELNKSELNKAKLQELESLRTESVRIIKEFNEKYLELLNQERNSLINEKEAILVEINEDIQKRLAELTIKGNSIATRVSTEIARIRTASNNSITQMNDFLANNENIKKMISESSDNADLLDKFRRLEEISLRIEENNREAPKIITDIPEILIKSVPVNENPNYYFDESIPFKERFSKLMDLKNRDIEFNNAIYHEKFDDVLTMIIENKTPYMYGPSGCGKTYMIEGQIAKLLGLDVTTNGYVLYEQDILGYTNSGNGQYVPSNFYRCMKFGSLIFFDELDNGIANATVVLNRFLGGQTGEKYVFPNGEVVKRHPNFRIISAGNTKGSGKTFTYNTRQKMDESIMQRVVPIEVNYDNRIEKVILSDYPNWYNFAINFRKAVETVHNNSGEDINSVGTFTTRDATSVKKYLDDKSFTDEQILLYEIIENKDIDYLQNITKNLDKLDSEGCFTAAGQKLLRKYNKIVESRRK